MQTYEKGQKQPSSHCCIEFSKTHFFPMSIVKRLTEKIESFTSGKLNFIVLWSTRNIKSLFPLKDWVKHLSCVIYEGKCSCGRRYIGETIRNSDIGWNEHESTAGKWKPAKHLADNKSHIFTWKVLASAPLHLCKRKILEAFFITKLKPNLNDQIEHHALCTVAICNKRRILY